MSKTLLILNGAPYGNENTYNGLRLAGSLSKRDGHEVKVFLMGDAALSAKKGQAVPKGFYNIELMLSAVTRQGGSVGVCGSCMDARGIVANELSDGLHRGSLEEVTEWTLWADKVLVF